MDKQVTIYANNHSPYDEAHPALENLKLLGRLFIGASAEAVDELIHRVQEQQAVIEQNHAGKLTIVPPDETDVDRLRYALLGLLLEAPDRMVSRLLVARQKVREATNLIDRMFSPITNNFLMRPLRQRHEARVAKVGAMIERLIDMGRTEEVAGRRLAQETTSAAMDEVFSYLAQNPELRQILQQQSVGLTDEVVDQLRNRAAAADTLVDRIVGAILRRPPSSAETASTVFDPPPQ